MALYLAVMVLLLDCHPVVVVVDHEAEVVESYAADAMYGAVLNSLPGERFGEKRRQNMFVINCC